MSEIIKKPKKERIRLIDIIIMNYVTLELAIVVVIGFMIIIMPFMPCYSVNRYGSYNRDFSYMNFSWILQKTMLQYIFWAFPVTRLFTQKYLTLNPKQGLEKCLRTLFIMSIPVIFAVMPKIWLYFGIYKYRMADGIEMLEAQSFVIASSLLIVNVAQKILIKGYSNISKYKLFVVSFSFIFLSIFAIPGLLVALSQDNILSIVLFFYPVIYSFFAYIELNYLPWGKRAEKQLKSVS